MQKICRLIFMAAMIVGCGATDEVPPEVKGVPSSYPTSQPKPPEPPPSNIDNGPNPNDCGVEYIVLKDGKGNEYLLEIVIPCDPWANIYKGCPPPLTSP
jgi:hypothetical protein